jgi:hypothetical protein
VKDWWCKITAPIFFLCKTKNRCTYKDINR